MTRRRKRRAIASANAALAATAVLLTSSCSFQLGDPGPEAPIDAAERVLTEFLDDDTPFGGLEIGLSEVKVIHGTPLREQVLYDRKNATAHPVELLRDPPTWIPAGSFPLSESINRIRQQFEECDASATARAWPLGEDVVLTRIWCIEDDVKETAMLNDDVLPFVENPMTREALGGLWDEIGAAGLEQIGVVSISSKHGSMWVEFVGAESRNTYEWFRPLYDDYRSASVKSRFGPMHGPFNYQDVSREQVLDAFDRAMAEVADPALVDRVEIGFLVTGLRLVLRGADLDDNVWVTVGED